MRREPRTAKRRLLASSLVLAISLMLATMTAIGPQALASGSPTPTASPASGTVTYPVPPLTPSQVLGLRAKTVGATVRLTWMLPSQPGIAQVVVVRSPGIGRSRSTVLYRGPAVTAFTDTHVRAGAHYLYSVAVISAGGQRSRLKFVVARLPSALLFFTVASRQPTGAPTLRWTATSGAAYYNVQLWYQNRTEVLSAWPTRNRLLLHAHWVYGGAHRRLVTGRYQWYVWPGFGAKRAARYGHKLGTATLLIGSGGPSIG